MKTVPSITLLSAALLLAVGCTQNDTVKSEPQPAKESEQQVRILPPPMVETIAGASEQAMYDSAPIQPQMAVARLKSEAKRHAPHPYEGESYHQQQENPRHQVAESSVSTFSMDVDSASYANVRRYLQNGQLPPAAAVRVEELINYFDYNYPTPESAKHPFAITTELAPSPWSSNSYLLQVGIKGYAPPQEQTPERNLVFLIDVSGSMQSANKLPLLKRSLRLLAKQLNHNDRVSMVVYAGSSGVVLPATPGNQHTEINQALERLRAGGSTYGEAGINLAYQLAQQNYIKGGINRVLLATDGDFNVGASDTESLLKLIKQKRQSGVGLTVLGFGMGNYNDEMLERISNAGDGNAAYIDSLHEAKKVLVNEMGSTLHTIAKDCKIQLEFNPATVSSYRLIGYENRILAKEDFSNDRVDAGDVGAGHTVTALYEITLSEEQGSRYQRHEGAYGHELAELRIRYKRPGESNSQLHTEIVQRNEVQHDLKQSSNNLRFAAAVAAFGQLLRDSEYVGDYQLQEAIELARASRGEDPHGYRSEFVKLAELAQALQ